MEPRRNAFLQQIRALHRDIGYFTAGLTVIFVLSGIAQIYRDTDLFRRPVQAEVQLAPGLDAAALGPLLRVPEFKVQRTEGSVLYFAGGSYDSATGKATRTEKRWIFPFDRLTSLHKTPSRFAFHWLTTIYAVALLFMATSSFFMFKAGTPLQRRGLLLAALGFAVALAMLYFAPAD